MVLTRAEKRALLLLLGCFAAGAVLVLWREGSLPFGAETAGKVRVSIGGAVLNPFDGDVNPGTRLGDLVREALPLESADLSRLPLPKKIVGEERFEVPFRARAVSLRKLDLNSATPEELEKLPGVGPQTAQRIVEERQARRKFYRAEELKEIPGIGEKKWIALKEHVEAR